MENECYMLVMNDESYLPLVAFHSYKNKNYFYEIGNIIINIKLVYYMIFWNVVQAL